MTSEHTLSSEDLATTVYVVGHNLAGYVPESDPYFTTDETSARQALADDLDRLWDSLEQIPEEESDERTNQEIAEVTEAHGEVNYATFPESWSVGYSSHWVDVRTLGELLDDAAERSKFATVDDALDFLNGQEQ